MIVKHKLNMDLTIRREAPRLAMVQCDALSRAVEMTLTENGAAWTPEGVETVLLRYRKADGTGGSFDTLPDGRAAWQLEGNLLTLLPAPQMLTVPGLVEAQAALMKADACIATFPFRIVVEEDPAANAVESEDYINWTAWAKAELDIRLAQARDSGEFDGAAFTPAVDSLGNLTWSNDAGAENPADINIADLVAEKLSGEVFLRAGGDAMSGTLDMVGNRVTGLAAPSADTDAVSRGYVRGLMHRETVLLSGDGWQEESQSVSVGAVTADNTLIVAPAPESHGVYGSCGIRCTAQAAGSLTFSCDDAPGEDVNVHVVILG